MRSLLYFLSSILSVFFWFRFGLELVLLSPRWSGEGSSPPQSKEEIVRGLFVYSWIEKLSSCHPSSSLPEFLFFRLPIFLLPSSVFSPAILLVFRPFGVGGGISWLRPSFLSWILMQTLPPPPLRESFSFFTCVDPFRVAWTKEFLDLFFFNEGMYSVFRFGSGGVGFALCAPSYLLRVDFSDGALEFPPSPG